MAPLPDDPAPKAPSDRTRKPARKPEGDGFAHEHVEGFTHEHVEHVDGPGTPR
jgi:hypothetical protein